VISHDREFLQGLCDKIYEFRDGKMKEFLGDINEYLEFRQKNQSEKFLLKKQNFTRRERLR
jgi:ATP-binding cassette subfamily F protein 3